MMGRTGAESNCPTDVVTTTCSTTELQPPNGNVPHYVEVYNDPDIEFRVVKE